MIWNDFPIMFPIFSFNVRKSYNLFADVSRLAYILLLSYMWGPLRVALGASPWNPRHPMQSDGDQPYHCQKEQGPRYPPSCIEAQKKVYKGKVRQRNVCVGHFVNHFYCNFQERYVGQKALGNYSGPIWSNNFSICLWENLKLLISMISGILDVPGPS